MVVKSRSTTVSGSYIDDTTGNTVNITVNDSQDVLVTSINGRGVDHIFEANHGKQTGSIMNGQLGAIRDFQACPAAFYNGGADYNSLNQNNWNVTSLLAATNPSRPDVLLPVFWAELRDLPDMLRQAGRIARRIYFERGSWANLIRPGSIHRDVAVANIVIQFGWRPFVSDLWKIASLQDSLEKRRKELKKLNSSKGLKRRLGLGSVSNFGSGTAQVWSTHGIGATVPYKKVEQAFAWGTASWRPTSGLPKWEPTDGQLRRQLSGFSADAILLNLWEGLPWSWLVDWFVPVGDTLKAGNRTVATPVSACVMVTRKTTYLFEGRTVVQNINRPWVITPGSKTSEVHQRSTLSGSPPNTASFPTIGANQLSILGSLAIMRAR